MNIEYNATPGTSYHNNHGCNVYGGGTESVMPPERNYERHSGRERGGERERERERGEHGRVRSASPVRAINLYPDYPDDHHRYKPSNDTLPAMMYEYMAAQRDGRRPYQGSQRSDFYR